MRNGVRRCNRLDSRHVPTLLLVVPAKPLVIVPSKASRLRVWMSKVWRLKASTWKAWRKNGRWSAGHYRRTWMG